MLVKCKQIHTSIENKSCLLLCDHFSGSSFSATCIVESLLRNHRHKLRNPSGIVIRQGRFKTLLKGQIFGWLVGWLCLMSHRQRGHLETAPPFTVPCKGREAQFLHHAHREVNPRPSLRKSITLQMRHASSTHFWRKKGDLTRGILLFGFTISMYYYKHPISHQMRNK